MAIPSSLVDPLPCNLPSTRRKSSAARLLICYYYCLHCCSLIGNARVFSLVFLIPSIDYHRYPLWWWWLFDWLYLHLLELHSTSKDGNSPVSPPAAAALSKPLHPLMVRSMIHEEKKGNRYSHGHGNDYCPHDSVENESFSSCTVYQLLASFQPCLLISREREREREMGRGSWVGLSI